MRPASSVPRVTSKRPQADPPASRSEASLCRAGDRYAGLRRQGAVRLIIRGMKARIGNIALDCTDVLKVATFWSAVIGRPLDPGASPGFASIGGDDPDRREPAWYFEKVPEPKQAKNRMHLDLVDPDPSAVASLVKLGATVVARHEIRGAGHRWTVMQDPEGNEFCIAGKSYSG